MKSKLFLLVIAIICIMTGCDIVKPKKRFRLAIPEKDLFYNYMAGHLKPLLDNKGFQIEIIKTKNSIEASQLVARGEADLTFINNHSVSITEKLGSESGRLRTVVPLSTRVLFAFSKSLIPDTFTTKELFENRKVGIEAHNLETQLNFENLLSNAKITCTQIVSFNDNPEVVVYWGTLYGIRAGKFLNEGWHLFSFNPNWIEFLSLNNPALRSFTLPAVPGDRKSKRINTVATDVVLVANNDIGEKSIYKLAGVLFQNRLELVHRDIMYRSMDESFDQKALLFPLHEGTTSYLRREEPTFFEKFADVIALLMSIIAILYGAIEAFRNNIARRKKAQLDQYFIDFLEIRMNKELGSDQKVKKLDDLFMKAVENMTNQKLEKADFNILSKLIQQELSIMRFNS
jgi:TRAP-type uncharacterized transport system substrate-binding protein